MYSLFYRHAIPPRAMVSTLPKNKKKKRGAEAPSPYLLFLSLSCLSCSSINTHISRMISTIPSSNTKKSLSMTFPFLVSREHSATLCSLGCYLLRTVSILASRPCLSMQRLATRFAWLHVAHTVV